QLRNIGAFAVAQHGGEGFAPEDHHGLQERLLVPGHLPLAVGPQALDALHHLELPVALEGGFQPLLHKGNERFGQKLHPLEDVLARGLGHLDPPQTENWSCSAPGSRETWAARWLSSAQSAISAL